MAGLHRDRQCGRPGVPRLPRPQVMHRGSLAVRGHIVGMTAGGV